MAAHDDGDEREREAREPAGEPLEEGDDSLIQSLLDRGYEQLDGFVSWLEESLKVDTRTAQQDCFNAEALMDYLANQSRKSPLDMNEFDLRWFMFNYYIRRAMADAQTEERLPDSLQRFVEYLRVRHAYEVPDWFYDVIDDRAYYIARRQAYGVLNNDDEREWETGFRAWSRELEEDLDSRVLWLPREMGEGMAWGDTMGWREATLQDEANQVWQEERQERLQEGLDYESVRERVESAYLTWLDTPQSRLDDRTPREVIFFERQEQIDEAGQG